MCRFDGQQIFLSTQNEKTLQNTFIKIYQQENSYVSAYVYYIPIQYYGYNINISI